MNTEFGKMAQMVQAAPEAQTPLEKRLSGVGKWIGILALVVAVSVGVVCVFFSSRRRHTMYIGDWSSDVCSSDLFHPRAGQPAHGIVQLPSRVGFHLYRIAAARRDELEEPQRGPGRDLQRLQLRLGAVAQIGRASCRERE